MSRKEQKPALNMYLVISFPTVHHHILEQREIIQLFYPEFFFMPADKSATIYIILVEVVRTGCVKL